MQGFKTKERLHFWIISLELAWKILKNAQVIWYSKDLISLVFKGQISYQYDMVDKYLDFEA